MHSSILPLPVTGCGCPAQPPCHSGSLQWCLQSVWLSGGEQWQCRFDLAGHYPELSGRSAHRCHENAVSTWEVFTCHRNHSWFLTLCYHLNVSLIDIQVSAYTSHLLNRVSHWGHETDEMSMRHWEAGSWASSLGQTTNSVFTINNVNRIYQQIQLMRRQLKTISRSCCFLLEVFDFSTHPLVDMHSFPMWFNSQLAAGKPAMIHLLCCFTAEQLQHVCIDFDRKQLTLYMDIRISRKNHSSPFHFLCQEQR